MARNSQNFSLFNSQKQLPVHRAQKEKIMVRLTIIYYRILRNNTPPNRERGLKIEGRGIIKSQVFWKISKFQGGTIKRGALFSHSKI